MGVAGRPAPIGWKTAQGQRDICCRIENWRKRNGWQVVRVAGKPQGLGWEQWPGTVAVTAVRRGIERGLGRSLGGRPVSGQAEGLQCHFRAGRGRQAAAYARQTGGQGGMPCGARRRTASKRRYWKTHEGQVNRAGRCVRCVGGWWDHLSTRPAGRAMQTEAKWP